MQSLILWSCWRLHTGTVITFLKISDNINKGWSGLLFGKSEYLIYSLFFLYVVQKISMDVKKTKRYLFMLTNEIVRYYISLFLFNILLIFNEEFGII